MVIHFAKTVVQIPDSIIHLEQVNEAIRNLFTIFNIINEPVFGRDNNLAFAVFNAYKAILSDKIKYGLFGLGNEEMALK